MPHNAIARVKGRLGPWIQRDIIKQGADMESITNTNEAFGRAVAALIDIFDMKDPALINHACDTILVIETLAKTKQRIRSLENVVEEIKKAYPPDDTPERRELWKKLTEIGLA